MRAPSVPLLPLIPSLFPLLLLLLLVYPFGARCQDRPLRGARREGSGVALADPTLSDDSDYADTISLDDDDSDDEASGEAPTPAPPPLLVFREARRGDAVWLPTPSPRAAPGAPAPLTARGPRPHLRMGSPRASSSPRSTSTTPSSTTSTSQSSTTSISSSTSPRPSTSTSPPTTSTSSSTATSPRSASASSTPVPGLASPGAPGRRPKRPNRRRRPPGRGNAGRTRPGVAPPRLAATPPGVRPTARAATPCEATSCPAGSYCLLGEGGGTSCPCSLGKGGPQCAEDVTARVPAFSGRSFLALPPLRGAHGELNISLELKAEAFAGSQNALLLFCGDREDTRPRDYLALSLQRGVITLSFDCGSGPARISAPTPVTPGSWHRVTLGRAGRRGQLTVDSQPPSTGLSQGPLSHISFRTALYVGGPPHAPLAGVGAPPGWGPPLSPLGFRGCVRALSVNGREVDARAAPRGHAERGANVGECGGEACTAAQCGQGAVCEVWDGEEALCLCPLGFSGPRCQDALAVRVPVFDAQLRSYAAALWPGGLRPPPSAMELELEFLPLGRDGTLLYSDDAGAGGGGAAAGDFVALVLRGGHLEMRFDCGSGTAVIRSAAPVTVGEWHVVRASRRARLGVLQLAGQAPISAVAPGSFTQIRCSSPLYLGGVPDYDAVRKNSGVTAPFTGTIQRLVVNGRTVALGAEPAGRLAAGANVGSGATACEAAPCHNGGSCRPSGDAYSCDCPLGYQGNSCQEDSGFFGANAVEDYEELPRFTGSSFISYESSNILKRVSGFRSNVFLRFKATGPDGLLLWRGGMRWGRGAEEGDYIQLGLQGGALIFSYDLGSGPAHILVNSSFNDGLWHRVKAVREGQTGKLTVDDFGAVVGRSPGHMTRLDLTGPLYLGGVRAGGGVAGPEGPHVSRGLEGCVSHLTLATDVHVALIAQATGGHNVQSC